MHEKSILELNKKRCLNTDANKSKNTQKMTPKSVPKDEGISGVAPLGAPLVALIAFGHQMLPPRALKVPPMIEKSIKNDFKEPPDCEKRASKFKLFGNLARRTARSAYNIRKNSKKRSVHEFRIDCPNDATPLMFASCGCVTFLHEPRSRSYGPYHEPTQIRLKFK